MCFSTQKEGSGSKIASFNESKHTAFKECSNQRVFRGKMVNPIHMTYIDIPCQSTVAKSVTEPFVVYIDLNNIYSQQAISKGQRCEIGRVSVRLEEDYNKFAYVYIYILYIIYIYYNIYIYTYIICRETRLWKDLR